jgi:hypothetical protein
MGWTKQPALSNISVSAAGATRCARPALPPPRLRRERAEAVTRVDRGEDKHLKQVSNE